jgi:hypothetical protein
MQDSMMKKIYIILGLSMIFCTVHAEQSTDMEALQRQLNAQTMNKSFQVESDAKLEAELQAALKKGMPPVTTPSKYWRNGYTCADIRSYSWRDYRNCRYHYRYYGRYW